MSFSHPALPCLPSLSAYNENPIPSHQNNKAWSNDNNMVQRDRQLEINQPHDVLSYHFFLIRKELQHFTGCAYDVMKNERKRSGICTART